MATIEKAIRSSDLGLNPANDGKVIRIPIPALTDERRKELSRHVHKMTEEGRNHVRIVRRDANDKLKKMLKEHQISEDDEKRALDEVQKITDQHIKMIDELQQKKDQELLGVAESSGRGMHRPYLHDSQLMYFTHLECASHAAPVRSIRASGIFSVRPAGFRCSPATIWPRRARGSASRSRAVSRTCGGIAS